ncbi:cobalt transporter ATP-binding subunit [Bacillus sp. FJAT-27916]|uniref:energy-coupling factor ABC transporter ATP-binding protein n=1 Tax=Bacillaceae TaxID=186817 RepID=UPI000670A568|nr:energy-coupling factor ABC transporter ATP-binding protein [Bacillus sp. FJAT-27916]KMY46069.1 cobalt transporter ATP-binding subunit [Bacillus sp. FJAT-27916]
MRKLLAEVSNVSFQYDTSTRKALDGISFSVVEGEWLAIVGHNGSGKSTLAKLLIGLNFPSEGKIKVGDMDMSEEHIWEIRRQIGMVFQNPDNQFVGTTVVDDVAFGLENAGIEREVMISRVKDALLKVRMDGFLNQEPHHLSGGQKQRVAIAGVLALGPSIIILDEATSMLDPMGKAEVLETIRQLKADRNLTVISITHDLEEAARADRMIVLNQGKIFAEGTPSEIFALDEELIKLGLDIPFSVKMGKLLREQGLDVSNHITEEGLVDELCKYRSNK